MSSRVSGLSPCSLTCGRCDENEKQNLPDAKRCRLMCDVRKGAERSFPMRRMQRDQQSENMAFEKISPRVGETRVTAELVSDPHGGDRNLLGLLGE